MLRSIARGIARQNMKKLGYHRAIQSGFFRENWKKFIHIKRR